MSYHTLTPVDDAASVREHEERFGGYNDAPPNFREIDEGDFAHGPFFSQCIRRVEHRQIVGVAGESGLLGVQLFFFSDATGVGMSTDHRIGRIRFFAFGCDHRYREVHGNELEKLGFRGSLFSHDHALHCDKCGDKKVVDSSG